MSAHTTHHAPCNYCCTTHTAPTQQALAEQIEQCRATYISDCLEIIAERRRRAKRIADAEAKIARVIQ